MFFIPLLVTLYGAFVLTSVVYQELLNNFLFYCYTALTCSELSGILSMIVFRG